MNVYSLAIQLRIKEDNAFSESRETYIYYLDDNRIINAQVLDGYRVSEATCSGLCYEAGVPVRRALRGLKCYELNYVTNTGGTGHLAEECTICFIGTAFGYRLIIELRNSIVIKYTK